LKQQQTQAAVLVDSTATAPWAQQFKSTNTAREGEMISSKTQRAVLFVASLTAVGLISMGQPAFLFSQSNPAVSAAQPLSNNIQVVSSANQNGLQQLVVLDQSLRTLAVYHVDATGNIQLRSVRSLVWDLRMEEFNGQTPTPSELKRVQP
jgi:anti-sigma-K factor RskA